MSDFWFYVVIAVIILHFVVGFVYLIYKMSPKKGEEIKDDLEEENENQ
ncbi:MAG: hypothetical protein KUG68_01305 [Flavobacteriaceae bacterium]|nr:hypothetical protein [Flavobacteriaceae bacterium]